MNHDCEVEYGGFGVCFLHNSGRFVHRGDRRYDRLKPKFGISERASVAPMFGGCRATVR